MRLGPALLLVASCGTAAERYLARTGEPLCEASVPARAQVDPPPEVPRFAVDLPAQGQEVLDVLRCCVPSLVVAPLDLGSFTLAIRGGADDGACDLLVEADVEGGYRAYACHAERPDLWGGWTEGTTPPIGALEEHCALVAEHGLR